MPILAKNLKTIRKELGCTQSVMSEILKVGFRTFVRYEAGARDVPVSVLVKIARLGNISLEQLLTSEIDKNDIAPLQKVNKSLSSTEVSVVNFKEGSVIFNNPSRQEFITLDGDERKMLTLFRKMGSHLQKDCLTSLGQIAEPGKSTSKLLDIIGKEQRAKKEQEEGLKRFHKISECQPKAKQKLGRKKLDKKALQEKIDKLKMLIRSINKIRMR
ncbi:MAG: helix-turn-helix transcriptional regulator [Nitrospinaceae bacterium]|nr:helix-turn-helix transcriptional regulator [Nitrospinaceae bacterium]